MGQREAKPQKFRGHLARASVQLQEQKRATEREREREIDRESEQEQEREGARETDGELGPRLETSNQEACWLNFNIQGSTAKSLEQSRTDRLLSCALEL